MRLVLLYSFAVAAFAQAVVTIPSDACREDSISWNGTSIGALVNLHGSFTYTASGGAVTNYGDTSCSGASSRTKGTSPESLTQVWRQGTAHQTTIRLEVTNPTANTIREYVSITNDGTETITGFRINLISMSVGETIGGNCSDSAILRTHRSENTYFMYLTWTAAVAAIWMGDLSQNASIYPQCNPGTSRIVPIRNPYTGAMGDLADLIGPGQTRNYEVLRRFHAPGTSLLEAGKDAIKIYGSASTPHLNWPDRRPIGTDFWGLTVARTANNPRGYFNNTLNALNTSTLQSFLTARATNNINLMNARNPRPQGIILWDIEGIEMDHAFTYVGSPNLLPIVAPEMDAVIDSVFAQYRNAGYKVGLTLRPQVIRIHDPGTRLRWSIAAGTLSSLVVSGGVATATTSAAHGLTTGQFVALRGSATTALNRGRHVITSTGANTFTFGFVSTPPADGTYADAAMFIEYASLPAEPCASSAGLDRDTIFLSGTFTYPTATRTATCYVPGEWRFDEYPDGPGEQTRTNDYDTNLNSLRAKVNYAIARWGVSIFYVDTNVVISGSTMPNRLWQDLAAEFPQVLFIPEWQGSATFQNAAPYEDYGNLGQLLISSSTMQGNPPSFSVNSMSDDIPNNDLVDWQKYLLRGGTPFNRAWFGDIQATRINTIYSGIIPMARCVDVGAKSFCASPRTAFTYPLVHRVYFASSSAGLAASTTYCEKTDQTRCWVAGDLQGNYDTPTAISLSGFSHYQLRYYDYAGTLVSNPGTWGVIQ